MTSTSDAAGRVIVGVSLIAHVDIIDSVICRRVSDVADVHN